MTKNQDLQKEILAKVKPGMKPSDLKKLKKSKSADDISVVPPTEIKSLKDEISVLNLELEIKNRELLEKDANLTIYSDQLNTKQKEIEELRKQLEETNAKLIETNTELDNCLKARHNSLKD
jgi:chromosome segregation ATPase